MGCFSGPRLESSQLVAGFDAANPKSYVGTGTTWNDLSGKGNTGALTYGPTYNSSNGGVIVFDGSNDCVVVNSNAPVLSSTGYTKTVWFYVTSFANSNNLISGGNNGRHALWLSNDNKLKAGHNSTWDTISSTRSLELYTWHHAAVTFSNETGWKLYLNGVLDSTNSSTSKVFSAYDVADALFAEVPYGVGYGATTAFLGGGEILIGGYGTGSNVFNGRISNAFVYNRVLSATEIQQNFNALSLRFEIRSPIVTSGLVLNLDAGNGASYSGSGTTWNDISGSGSNATLTNGPTYSSANGGSIIFNGSSQYAGGSFSSPINLSYYTVDFWIKPSAFANYNQHVSFSTFSDTSPWNGFVFHTTSSGTIYTGTQLGNRMSAVGGSAAMTLNVWQNYTFVNNNGTCDLYKNGVSYVTQACGVSASNNTVYTLGATPSGGSSNGYINGNIASLKVYSGKALSAAEVSQNFNALRSRFGI